MLVARESGKERRKIITHQGRQGRQGQGQSGCGRLSDPCGYACCADRLVIPGNEAKIVKIIYQWYIEGHLSLYAISANLSEIGLSTPFIGGKAK